MQALISGIGVVGVGRDQLSLGRQAPEPRPGDHVRLFLSASALASIFAGCEESVTRDSHFDARVVPSPLECSPTSLSQLKHPCGRQHQTAVQFMSPSAEQFLVCAEPLLPDATEVFQCARMAGSSIRQGVHHRCGMAQQTEPKPGQNSLTCGFEAGFLGGGRGQAVSSLVCALCLLPVRLPDTFRLHESFFVVCQFCACSYVISCRSLERFHFL